jgi:hypothetical protein
MQTLQTYNPGQILDDGSIVIEHQPRTIFYNERLLVVAPRTTVIVCNWTPEFKPVFDKLKEKGFNPSDWFIPSIDQLRKVYESTPESFDLCCYWSSDEDDRGNALSFYFENGKTYTDHKPVTLRTRAFRKIEL